MIAQRIEQGHPWFQANLVGFSVDSQTHRDRTRTHHMMGGLGLLLSQNSGANGPGTNAHTLHKGAAGKTVLALLSFVLTFIGLIRTHQTPSF